MLCIEIILIIIVMSVIVITVIVFIVITFTDDDVTLKVNSVAVGELEHGEEASLCCPSHPVVTAAESEWFLIYIC